MAFWNKKNPSKKSKKMYAEHIRYAKALSKKKGWKYPSLLANSIALKKKLHQQK